MWTGCRCHRCQGTPSSSLKMLDALKVWIGKSVAWVELNGQPALSLSEDGIVTTAFTVTASTNGIEQLMWLMNPAKLGNVTDALT